jgi:hypothetical protein
MYTEELGAINMQRCEKKGSCNSATPVEMGHTPSPSFTTALTLVVEDSSVSYSINPSLHYLNQDIISITNA